MQNVMPTTEQVKDAFVLSTKIKNGAEHDKEKEPSIKFMKAYDEFVSEGSIQNAWSDSTLKKFATAKKHLNAFDPDTNFDVWTDKHFNEYIDYLRTQKDMRNSSIVKQIKFLKWFLCWASRKGYNQNMAFEKFMPKLKSASQKVIFLTTEEMKRIRELLIQKHSCSCNYFQL